MYRVSRSEDRETAGARAVRGNSKRKGLKDNMIFGLNNIFLNLFFIGVQFTNIQVLTTLNLR